MLCLDFYDAQLHKVFVKMAKKSSFVFLQEVDNSFWILHETDKCEGGKLRMHKNWNEIFQVKFESFANGIMIKYDLTRYQL